MRKADLKNATGVDTSDFAKKVDLAILKSEVEKLALNQLNWNLLNSVDLSKLSDVVKNEVVKNTVYGVLVKKVNAIETTDTSNLVKTADYNTIISEFEKRILDHDHGKYITTQEFNKLTTEDFASRLLQIKQNM